MVTDTWKCSPEEQNTSLRTWLHYQTLEKKTNVAWSMVEHNNITACISLDCLPQGDDAEAEEEEDIYVVVHNRTQHNRTERNTNCVPLGDDTEAVTDS